MTEKQLAQLRERIWQQWLDVPLRLPPLPCEDCGRRDERNQVYKLVDRSQHRFCPECAAKRRR